jgi:hypothetical protein
MPRIVLAAVAASVVVVGALATPVQAQTQTTTQTCTRNFVGSGSTCTTTTQQGSAQNPALKMTRQEVVDEAARVAKWEEVCKPRISRDRYGVARYSYAQPDCEHGLTGQ